MWRVQQQTHNTKSNNQNKNKKKNKKRKKKTHLTRSGLGPLSCFSSKVRSLTTLAWMLGSMWNPVQPASTMRSAFWNVSSNLRPMAMTWFGVVGGWWLSFVFVVLCFGKDIRVFLLLFQGKTTFSHCVVVSFQEPFLNEHAP